MEPIIKAIIHDKLILIGKTSALAPVQISQRQSREPLRFLLDLLKRLQESNREVPHIFKDL